MRRAVLPSGSRRLVPDCRPAVFRRSGARFVEGPRYRRFLVAPLRFWGRGRPPPASVPPQGLGTADNYFPRIFPAPQSVATCSTNPNRNLGVWAAGMGACGGTPDTADPGGFPGFLRQGQAPPASPGAGDGRKIFPPNFSTTPECC